jgi:hypothetical protein
MGLDLEGPEHWPERSAELFACVNCFGVQHAEQCLSQEALPIKGSSGQ